MFTKVNQYKEKLLIKKGKKKEIIGRNKETGIEKKLSSKNK